MFVCAAKLVFAYRCFFFLKVAIFHAQQLYVAVRFQLLKNLFYGYRISKVFFSTSIWASSLKQILEIRDRGR